MAPGWMSTDSEAAVWSEGLTEGGAISKLIPVVAGRTHFHMSCWTWGSHFLTDCWPETFLSSLPPGPLHRAAGLVRAESRGKEGWELPASCNLVSKVTDQHFFLILLVKMKPRSRSYSRWGNYRRSQRHWGHLRGCLLQRCPCRYKQTAFTHKPLQIVEGTSSALHLHSLHLFYPNSHGISSSVHFQGWPQSSSAAHFSLTSLHHSGSIWIWEASPTLIVWEQLIQSPSFANKNAEAQGREGASLRSPRKPEARLELWTSDAPNMLHNPTPQDPGWEINANQALELWGDCRHFINIQMRETFRPLLSLLLIPFYTGG